MVNRRIYKVPAVSRVLDIFEYLCSKQDASLTEVFRDIAIPKSSAYQILRTLENRGYVRHLGDTDKYVLGIRLLELGDKAGAMIDIRTEAMPTLKELSRKTNETCHLGILDGAEGVYIAKVDSNQLARMNTWEGKRLPMHSTALGKILLAWLPMKDLDEIISHLVFTPYTPNTITNSDVFRKNLKKVAKKGWALDDQENVLHFRCVGVPVRDDKNRVIAAISVTGLASNFEGAHLSDIIEESLIAARQLSEKIGGRY